jgi:hypothetical protein
MYSVASDEGIAGRASARPSAAVAPMLSEGYVSPVTRKVSLTDETNLPNQAPGQIFCDWISIYQHHGLGLPVFADGCVIKYDADGVHEFTTLKKSRIEGSHESAVFIRCDGETVWFEGNVSKFGRQDNVFGYSFDQCIERINALLATLGLPPFTAGKRMEAVKYSGDDAFEWVWTGARLTRIDVTENFVAGSKENAYAFMRFLAGQQASRLKTGVYGEGETVDFGRGSKYAYAKAYLKGPELLRHARKLKDPDNARQRAYSPYLEMLAAWCSSIGLVRFETTYKARYLTQHKLQYLGAFNMNQLELDFAERKSVFTRSECDVDQLTDLEPKTLAMYRMWQAGDDITSKCSRATFYRHRARLLPYGVDIAIKSNVIKFQPKTRVITLGPVSPPDFYELPHPSIIRLAA